MSYEGYEKVLCAVGHLRMFDAHDSPFSQFSSESGECSCGQKFVWYISVDQTNGAYCQVHDYDGPCDLNCKQEYPGDVELETDKPAVTETCNLGHAHILQEETYKIPIGVGHMVVKQ